MPMELAAMAKAMYERESTPGLTSDPGLKKETR